MEVKPLWMTVSLQNESHFDLYLYTLIPDRYFRCEPMDATVSPIALTSQNTSGTPATPAGNSNGSSSNPGTPTN